MKQVLKKKLKEITGQTQCHHASCCIDTEFDKSCKVRDVGIKDYLVCLEEGASLCQFSVKYGNTFFCSCPLRVYIYKNLSK